MAALIQNGRAFPQVVKMATVAEIRSNPTKRRNDIAVERNMSSVTVGRWAHEAGIKMKSHQHPNTAAGVARHWAAYKATKLFNTPTTQANGTIMYRGNTYQTQAVVKPAPKPRKKK